MKKQPVAQINPSQSYKDEHKQMMVRLHEKLSDEIVEVATAEALRLGPEALRLLITFPEPLILPALRHWIVRVLLAAPRAGAMPIILEGLSHPDWRITQICRDALAKMGVEAKDALVANLRACKSPGGKVQTLLALHRLSDPFGPLAVGDRSLMAPIARCVRDESEEVRATALEALSRSEAREAACAIVRALKDKSPRVRLEAVKAAGRLRLKQAVKGLVALLRSKDPEFRADVLYALDRIGDPDSSGPAVRRMLADRDGYVRWTAVKALENLWQEDNVAALARAAKDRSATVVIAAIETLARKAPDAAKAPLAAAMKHRDATVRETARFYAS